ncbi:hypothetical protein [Mucilaginibacter sp.]|uniref:hypothetical protein n=1 Tax=Mucilaginibacter sp. TaxID=1882438 RepID=UPI0028422993|nr:hypothetical protein [Mucilaginibacter sp.]MDR3695592.1 hypothetical protein [Mucilaginibacter sp.]
MLKPTNTYKVSPKARLDEIFTNGLPVNAFIDKGRCAIGATYGEIMYKERCTIIVVPNISILLSKQNQHQEIDIVYRKVTPKEVEEYLSEYKPGQKIMTTPEGMSKIMKAAEKNGRLEELYRNWFLLLDESHTFISEFYRKDILLPFRYFWLFDKKSIISATPFVFSDPRFSDLDYYKIEFTKKLGTVLVLHAKSVFATLHYILTHLDQFPGNLHIFYNSVIEIVRAINRAGLTICNIFCANDKDNANMNKLGDLVKFFVAEPETGIYKKVNFYTCKYFEGWDLYDQNATVLLVTDVHSEHTMVGVNTKGKQAIGRLRDTPYNIIHLTNHKYTRTMKPLEEFRKEYLHQAQLMIKHNNSYVNDCNERGLKPEPDERLDKFADINDTTNIATLNLMKLDQKINQAANNEIYNHIDYVRKDWEDGYFKVESQYSDLEIETTTTIKRKSAAKQLEEDYLRLKSFKEKQQDTMIFSLGQTVEQEVKANNPIAYKAYQLLDEPTLLQLKYNVKKVQAAIIMKENISVEVKLLKLIGQTFDVGKFYPNDDIKSKLQDVYNKLNIREENGKVKIAKANQLGDKGRFETHATKGPDKNGNSVHGLLILRSQFGLRMVA